MIGALLQNDHRYSIPEYEAIAPLLVFSPTTTPAILAIETPTNTLAVKYEEANQ
jgi:hypothetical protein